MPLITELTALDMLFASYQCHNAKEGQLKNNMGIITKFKEYFVDVYKTEQKSLAGEFGYNGSFVPVDNIGNYTVLGKGQNPYNKVGIVYMIVSKIARRVGEAIIEHKQDDEEKTKVANSEILKKLKNPNKKQNLSEFLAEIASYKLLKGEFYIWTEKGDFTGKIIDFWVIPPSLISKVIGGYKVGKTDIPDDQIYHYRDFVPDYFIGDENSGIALSPLEVAGINLRIIDYAGAANYKTLKAGAVQGVAYEKPQTGMLSPSPEQVKELRDLLVRRYNSPEMHGEVTIHSEEIGYTKFGLNPAELMIMDNINFNEERICDVFNYPRILLGDKGGSLGGNIRTEAKKEFILDAVFPILSVIVQSLTNIFKLENESICFDKDSFPEMQVDWVSTSQALERMPYLDYNEKRKIIGYEPKMEFDGKVFMPSNLIMLDELENGGSSQADTLPNTGDFNA
jgi:HK97 family phage portal protein